MTLPYDYSRCAGQTDWRTKEPGKPEKLDAQCVECRRREPGHTDRQVYLGPQIDESGVCLHRIGPA